MIENSFWINKQVLVTGHTGFKGSWLSLWLNNLGAKVHGLALDPPTQPNLFTIANIKSLLASDTRLDIQKSTDVKKLLCTIKPEIVFHLAALPLVQYAYDFPLDTYAVNVMGTVNILEAIRICDSVRAAVIITTDKCYENDERNLSYSEKDRLGGKDPYSSSKACAELVTSAYRASYFSNKSNIHMASARAGNVIGGGDWATDRLIPDCIRAYTDQRPMTLRFPNAVRPWQHVLESIHGYILLAEHLLSKKGSDFAEAWNFGPEMEDMKPVGYVAKMICDQLNIPLNMPVQEQKRHEASLLRLDSSKAQERLNWHATWNLEKAIEETIQWYRYWINGCDMVEYSRLQLESYLLTQKEMVY